MNPFLCSSGGVSQEYYLFCSISFPGTQTINAYHVIIAGHTATEMMFHIFPQENTGKSHYNKSGTAALHKACSSFWPLYSTPMQKLYVTP
jgi:hypothetical protein